ncbi:unnamed protein product [Adineta steineri]|uniref:DUF7709 domain-containing protein n=1 Tax=Adineta steineri TaxID=433720 RepID=A0A819U8Y0_9BILA|nr:unnamed protein product [Adineta steineri]CAF4091581.1 unnamed protein product [Adineta steineri]
MDSSKSGQEKNLYEVDGSDSREIAIMNAKILKIVGGATLPNVQLEDGSYVQTGTVAAMLKNVARYNAGERGVVEVELERCIPTVARVGLFALFSVDEWLNTTTNPGRKFIGEKAQQFFAGGQKF